MAGGSTLTGTEAQVVELARDFARTHIEPKAAEWDRTKEFPRDVILELGKLGFLGMCTPEEWDGMGIDSVTYLMALEEIAAADASVAVTVSIQNAIPTVMLTKHGTPAQKERWLKPLARGEIIVGFALSEPDAGSDPASMRAQAVRSGDGWVLNGLKAWATNAGTADLMMIMVRTDTPEQRRGAKGISTFIVPTDTAGYKAGKPEDKMGLRASNTATIALEDVRLPKDALLGDEGMGFVYAMEGLDAGRLGIAAQATGIARRALEHTIEYCAVRKQFNQALRDFQGVQFKLADMATRVEAGRALAHAAGARRDHGLPITHHAAMAKLFASEGAMWVTTQAIQLFGGYGYMRDYPVEKLFRDAKVTEIYEGTSEIQRIVIARGLGAGA